MKKSRAVPLILLGTLSLLTACGPGEQTEIKQNNYVSKEDCMSDWGRDERDCTPVNTLSGRGTGTGGTGGHGYIGPRFFWYHGGGYPVAVDSDGSTRPLPNSYMSRPGTTSRSIGTTTSHVSGRYSGGGTQMGGSRSGGGGGHTSRGGFGGTSHGISGGG